MKLANTSKRVLPWFSIVFFLIAAICMFLNLLRTNYLEYVDGPWHINYLQFSIGAFHFPIPQLLPVSTNILSVILFFFLTFIAAALLGITKKHCFFPAVLGLSILLLQLIMIIQNFLFFSEFSLFKQQAIYMGFPDLFLLTSNICQTLYCLPMSILAVYMIIASFLKVTGKKMIVITVVVVLLTMVATLLLSIPLDVLQVMPGRERVAVFSCKMIEILFSSYILNINTLKEILFTWGALLFQFGGFLLYLPAALYRPKTPKTGA